jgi:hypothetical protein
VLKSPERARAFLQCRMAHRTHEVFAVLLLDEQHRLIKYLELFRGTIDTASVYPREAVKEALAHGAVGVILAHNHPSGCMVRSLTEKGLTEKSDEPLPCSTFRCATTSWWASQFSPSLSSGCSDGMGHGCQLGSLPNSVATSCLPER